MRTTPGPLRPRGRPSIASLLPRRPPPGVRIIVTSRPDPGLPDDVPSGHPLRTCVSRRLPVSWVAEDLELRAKQELRDLLAGDQTAIDVVGYIAGSGGGLTGSDLAALTGAPPHEARPRPARACSGAACRPARPRIPATPEPIRRRGCTCSRTRPCGSPPRNNSAASSPATGKRVHDWIGSYADRGWPERTPGYAIRGYPRLLTATRDVTRLSALARDPRRHAFLLQATGSDYAALTEIRTAQSLIADQNVPDLQALVELAVYRHAISIRNQSIPADLPAVWARLARFDHAEALARAITDPDAQAQALAELATAAAQAGDLDRAEALARTITEPRRPGASARRSGRAAAQAGDLDRAEALARTITDPAPRPALTGLASAAARPATRTARPAGRQAETLARAITDPDGQAQALTELATAAAQAGDLDRAEALARTITDPDDQAWALAELATAAAQAGDLDRASRLAADAEALARTITDPGVQARALAGLAHRDRRRPATWTAPRPWPAPSPTRAQARALAELASAAARPATGPRDRLAADAEALARTITDPDTQAWALAELASAAAQAGDPDRASRLAADAEALARTITDPVRPGARRSPSWPARSPRPGTWTAPRPSPAPSPTPTTRRGRSPTWPPRPPRPGTARPRREAGSPAPSPTPTPGHGRSPSWPARSPAGDPDRASRLAADAEALARTITDPDDQARALTDLATATAQAGDLDRASRLAADAEALARTITDPGDQARGARRRWPARPPRPATWTARPAGRRRRDPRPRHHRPGRSGAGAHRPGHARSPRPGDLDRAEALARTITDPYYKARGARRAGHRGRPGRGPGPRRGPRPRHHRPRRSGARRSPAWPRAQPPGPGTWTAPRPSPAPSPTRPTRRRRSPSWPARPPRPGTWTAPRLSPAPSPTRTGQARALAELATAQVAQAGDLDRAEALARTITDPDDQARGARSPGQRGRPGRGPGPRARPSPAPSPTPCSQARALAGLASAVAQAGDTDRASRLAAEAEASPAPSPSPTPRRGHSPKLASAAAQAGDTDRASRLAADVEAMARTITDPDDQALALAQARELPARTASRPWPAPSPTRHQTGARRAGRRGDLDRAEALARAITEPDDQAQALAKLASAAALGRRPGPRRGPGPRHHRPVRSGAGARRAGQRGRPGRRPGPRRGPGPRHHRLVDQARGARRAGRRGPGRRPGPRRGPGPRHQPPATRRGRSQNCAAQRP